MGLSERSIALVLGAGCLGFTAWAFRRPGRLAELIGGDVQLARKQSRIEQS